MKKLLAVVLSVAMAMTSIGVFAATVAPSRPTTKIVKVTKRVVTQTKTTFKLYGSPVIKYGRYKLPIRPVTKGLGATVAYDKDTHIVTVTKGEKVITINFENGQVTIDGVVQETATVNLKKASNKMNVMVKYLARKLGKTAKVYTTKIVLTKTTVTKKNVWQKRVTYKVDGNPVIKYGRYKLPIRPITKGMGATLTYDKTTHIVTITKGEKVITINFENGAVTVNGEKIATTLRKATNKMNVMVKLVAKLLGKNVVISGNNITIVVVIPAPTPTPTPVVTETPSPTETPTPVVTDTPTPTAA